MSKLRRATVTAALLAIHGIAVTTGEDETPVCPNADFKLRTRRRYAAHSKLPDGPVNGRLIAEASTWAPLHMLEIGGPTSDTSLYNLVKSADNVIRNNNYKHFANVDYNDWSNAGFTIPDSADVDNTPFRVPPDDRVMGRTIQRHGANLHGLANQSYDVVFSSHNLEHFLDPIAALLEWHRVLKPGGFMVLVLPHVTGCSDRYREPPTMQELLHVHHAAKEGGEEYERYRRMYTETFVRLFHDFEPATAMYDPWQLSKVKDTDKRRKIIRTTIAGDGEGAMESCDYLTGAGCTIDEDLLHWHLLDFDVLHELVVGCLGYEIVLMELQPPKDNSPCPNHQVVWAVKPPFKLVAPYRVT